MTGIALTIFLSALPFFKEMIFGKKTKLEKITSLVMFLCFIIVILSMIVMSNFSNNYFMNKENRRLIDEKVILEKNIESLKQNKLLNSCRGSNVLIADLETKLTKAESALGACKKEQVNKQEHRDSVKGILHDMD